MISGLRFARSIALLVVALASAPLLASGQTSPPSDADEEQARAHYNTGAIAFGSGRFADALTEFQKSYALSQRPKLLYNIGATFDRLRRDAEALAAFEEFLQRVPQAEQRTEVEARIVLLRDALTSRTEAAQSPTPSPTQSPTPTPQTEPTVAPTAVDVTTIDTRAPSDRAHPSVGQWVVLGGSALFAVTGGVLLTVAMLDKSNVEGHSDGTRLPEIESAHDRVPLFSTLGGVMLGAGVIGAGLATTWIVLSGPKESPQVTANVGLGQLMLRGTF